MRPSAPIFTIHNHSTVRTRGKDMWPPTKYAVLSTHCSISESEDPRLHFWGGRSECPDNVTMNGQANSGVDPSTV